MVYILIILEFCSLCIFILPQCNVILTELLPYLQRYIHISLKSTFTKLRLSSHRVMVESGRWMKPKVQYIDRKCTLCNDNGIQDEYHIMLKCAYYNEVRRKYIKPYYHRHPSMYKFQELINKSNKRDTFCLMICIQIVMKDYDSTR